MGKMTSGWQVSMAILELLGLTMWIGGLTVILTAIIPAVFNTLGMETGGHFLRRVFDSYNMLTSGVVVLLLATMAIQVWQWRLTSGNRLPILKWEIGILAGMVVVTIMIVGIMGPKAIALQEHAFAAEDEIAKKKAYEAFFQTHMIVRALHLLNAGLAVSLLVVKFKRWVTLRGACGDEFSDSTKEVVRK